MSGQLKKLTISPCTVSPDGVVDVQGPKFEVMLNPSSYSHQYVISYQQPKVQGKSGTTLQFSTTGGEQISFDMLLDGTGVAAAASSGPVQDVKSQVRALNSVAYEYKGNDHEPSVVRVLWGSLIFFGRLQSMSAQYTLFQPNGDPLRAKVKVTFIGFMSSQEESLKANRSSPDLSHSVEVRAGDTLPLLCYRIYKDSSYYPEVARHNELSDFRDLEPGLRLKFPPLAPRVDRRASGSGVRKYPRSRRAPRPSTP